jgi:hypothetical protein
LHRENQLRFRRGSHGLLEVLEVADGPAVDKQDPVAGSQSRLGGRRRGGEGIQPVVGGQNDAVVVEYLETDPQMAQNQDETTLASGPTRPPMRFREAAKAQARASESASAPPWVIGSSPFILQ